MKKSLLYLSQVFLLALLFQHCKQPVDSGKNSKTTGFKSDAFMKTMVSPIELSGINPEKIMFSGEVNTSIDSGKFIIETENYIFRVDRNSSGIYFVNKFTLDSCRLKAITGKIQADPEKLVITGVKRSKRKENEWRITTRDKLHTAVAEVVDKGILKLTIESDKKNEPISREFSVRGPFYGGGERFISACLNGRSFINQPNDHFFLKNFDLNSLKHYEPTYLSIPFTLNPHGFGLYSDNSGATEFSIDKEGSSLIVTTNDGILVLYLFAGKSPKDILSIYTSLVGRQPMIPEWGLGVWANLLEGRDSVLAKASRLRKKNIPVDAVWIFDFDDPSTCTGWTNWSRGYYGNPRIMTDSLHKMNLKVLTYLHPYVPKKLLYYRFNSPIYEACIKKGYLLKVDSTIDNRRYATGNPYELLDFFNASTRNWWNGVITEILQDDNFDGWMEDFGDISYKYDYKLNEWSVIDYKTEYPFSNEVLANVYPLVYHKTTFTAAKPLKSDFIGFCRSGSAGSAPYTSLLWGGDQTANWDKKSGYPSVVTAGISAGLSGYGLWAPDILCNSPSMELWKRWVQLGAFSPTMRDHLWSNNPKSIDLWTNDHTMQYFAKYAQMHKALEPYLLDLAKESAETGIPIIRHMMLEYPTDTAALACEYQYMLGTELIVAPVVEEHATSRNVYLPEGKWVYFWSKKEYDGKSHIRVEAPVDQIPFFTRKNSTSESVNNFLEKIPINTD